MAGHRQYDRTEIVAVRAVLLHHHRGYFNLPHQLKYMGTKERLLQSAKTMCGTYHQGMTISAFLRDLMHELALAQMHVQRGILHHRSLTFQCDLRSGGAITLGLPLLQNMQQRDGAIEAFSHDRCIV